MDIGTRWPNMDPSTACPLYCVLCGAELHGAVYTRKPPGGPYCYPCWKALADMDSGKGDSAWNAGADDRRAAL